jgi:hypothetical protein
MLANPLPLQTTYAQYEIVGMAGMPATQTGWDGDNRIVEDPTGNGIAFGLAVCQGYQSDKGCTLGQLSGGGFVGITMIDITLPLVQSRAKVDTYYDTDNINIMVRGDIWVAPPTGMHVNSGDPAWFNAVTGQIGSSSIPNAVRINNSRWQTSLPNLGQPSSVNFGGLAVVRIGASAQ